MTVNDLLYGEGYTTERKYIKIDDNYSLQTLIVKGKSGLHYVGFGYETRVLSKLTTIQYFWKNYLIVHFDIVNNIYTVIKGVDEEVEKVFLEQAKNFEEVAVSIKCLDEKNGKYF